MRKWLWIMALLFGVVGAPNAQADSSLDASFTCTTSCVSVPTDPSVQFPGPIIPVDFFSETFNITLSVLDNPTDTYTWGIGLTGSSWYFQIDDITSGTSDTGPSFVIGGSGTPYGSGSVYFTVGPTATPEPSSGTLMLLGVGIAFLVSKFMGHSRTQAI